MFATFKHIGPISKIVPRLITNVYFPLIALSNISFRPQQQYKYLLSISEEIFRMCIPSLGYNGAKKKATVGMLA